MSPQKLKDRYEEMKGEGNMDEKELYEMLKKKYEEMVLEENNHHHHGPKRDSQIERSKTEMLLKLQSSEEEGESQALTPPPPPPPSAAAASTPHPYHYLLLPTHSPPLLPESINKSRPLRHSESLPNQIHIGDVVRCKMYKGECIFYEGVVVENYYDGNFLVDFGDADHNEVKSSSGSSNSSSSR